MNNDRPNIDPMAQALGWVSKITTVALEMALPAIGGGYLDRRWGTNHWALAGLVLGLVVGMWHLLQMTKANSRRKDGGAGDGASDQSESTK